MTWFGYPSAGSSPISSSICSRQGGHEQNPAAVRSAYRAERSFEDGPWSVREIDLHDQVSGLTTTTRLRTIPGLDVVRAETTVRNDGDAPVVLEAVSSLVIVGLSIADFEAHWADNDWLAEGRWRSRPVREVLPDVNTSAHGDTTPRGRFTVAAHGTWSSGGRLPMGALTGPHSLLRQIEIRLRSSGSGPRTAPCSSWSGGASTVRRGSRCR